MQKKKESISLDSLKSRLTNIEKKMFRVNDDKYIHSILYDHMKRGIKSSYLDPSIAFEKGNGSEEEREFFKTAFD